MVRWLGILLRTFRSAVRTRRELALENLALRQQLAVWNAREPRLRLTELDRIFWVVLSRYLANLRSTAWQPKHLEAILEAHLTPQKWDPSFSSSGWSSAASVLAGG